MSGNIRLARRIVMTEIEIIARAQMYMEKLANGVDPLTDREVSENDVVNNVRISRCLFYVSGILKKIVDNKGKFQAEMPEREEYSATPEQLANFEYSQYPVSITDLTKKFNDIVDTLRVKELRRGIIADWLVSTGMLTEVVINDRARKTPTAAGRNIGIITEERTNQYGTPYTGVFYNIDAQHFIVDNADAIIEMNRQKSQKQ